jgi:FlaA1/EpsC-like NDP-sugar epimerase
MDIPSATDLILTAGEIARGREIFILKMPALRITDLAEAIIEEHAPKCGYKPEDIPIKIIGKRIGEKVHEELIAEEEVDRAYERDNLFLIIPNTLPYEEPLSPDFIKGFIKTKNQTLHSNNAQLIPKEEIKKLLNTI